MTHAVEASALYLRRTPEKIPSNIIRPLSRGERVSVLNSDGAEWWHVRTEATPTDGWVASRYLAPANGARLHPMHVTIEAVHCTPTADSRRSSVRDRHCPLGEPNLPTRDLTASIGARTTAIGGIISFLDVERSPRYAPTSQTFCNIYAYDVCFLSGAYLPRVWWTDTAIAKLSQGIPQPVGYATTVTELNANALYHWLNGWGASFGWTNVDDLGVLQQDVNDRGSIGVICALRRKLPGQPRRSGHITVVLAETGGSTALRQGSQVIAPVQTQSGRVNKARSATAWWVTQAAEFEAVGFWRHD